ncbi:hypothetical protein M405DRAFT_834895 [Rhizopogon salebrosus TDB-379]|nr:hypothetical protein M405DRAFT_834895 [Rhizopogon salebrosus TDB-379]
MSDHIIAPRNYRITSNAYPKQLVSVVDHTIVGNQELLGGIQIWRLRYEGRYATFQGVSPTREAKGYIAISEDGGSLVYTLEGPSRFVLGMPDPEYQDLLSVTCEDHIFPVRAWFLPSGEDGTRIELPRRDFPPGDWIFTSCDEE